MSFQNISIAMSGYELQRRAVHNPSDSWREGGTILTLNAYAKKQRLSHPNLINKAKRQTIEAFLEHGEWKIGELAEGHRFLDPNHFPPHPRRTSRQPRSRLADDSRGESSGSLSCLFDRASKRESTEKNAGEGVSSAR